MTIFNLDILEKRDSKRARIELELHSSTGGDQEDDGESAGGDGRTSQGQL